MRSFVFPLLGALVLLGGCTAQQAEEGSTGVKLDLSNYNGLSNTDGLSTANTEDQISSRAAAVEQMRQEMSSTVDTVNANMGEGLKRIMEPMMAFMATTAPNIGHLYWMVQGCPVRREVVNAAKDMWGQGALKMSQLMGRGFVGGSQVAKGAMEGMGKAMSNANFYANGAANAAMDVMTKVADTTMMIEMKKLELVMKAIQEVAKALQNAGPMSKVVADNLQVTMKAVEEKIKTSAKDVEEMMQKVIKDGAQVMMDGSIQFQNNAKKHWYNILKSYADMLKKVRMQLEAVNNRIKTIENSVVTLDMETQVNSGTEKVAELNIGQA